MLRNRTAPAAVKLASRRVTAGLITLDRSLEALTPTRPYSTEWGLSCALIRALNTSHDQVAEYCAGPEGTAGPNPRIGSRRDAGFRSPRIPCLADHLPGPLHSRMKIPAFCVPGVVRDRGLGGASSPIGTLATGIRAKASIGVGRLEAFAAVLAGASLRLAPALSGEIGGMAAFLAADEHLARLPIGALNDRAPAHGAGARCTVSPAAISLRQLSHRIRYG